MFELPKKIFQTVLPPLAGLFFIYLSFYYTSGEERNEIYKSFKEAKIEYIFLSILLGIASHISRAYRWNFLFTKNRLLIKSFILMISLVFIIFLAMHRDS